MQKTPKKDKEVIKIIIREYQKNTLPWYIGYSGGKDSSSMLKLVFNALKQVDSFHKPITVLYCDTGC
ncbi:Rossmann-like alpha/beta/alpha sandwich fold protein [Dokdonia sp. MED134]|uniref:hypothetical protein n=1 Tax=Dokdonia sp. MED134 TaxID=313590 RepID=UPI000068AA83|nr:hypothetical protein [Dokdonia sp. MED134]AIN49913.1 Rossmann-like alpha/beta/alpha sandwich fold protein [Dokdonia sp. MED134]